MSQSFAERLHETRLGLGRRIVQHIRDNTSDLADAPMRNDVAVYTDPARHAAERQKLFRETPVIACLSSELREAGDFRTFDDTGVPIVIARGRDGEVRAFLNVCLHRGARLVREPRGRANLFTCWFHGWSYANDGRLAAVPEAERFADQDGASALPERDHLIAVPVAERFGLVFVQATPGSTMDIDAHLGAVRRATGAAGTGQGRMGQGRRASRRLELEVRPRHLRRRLPFRRPAQADPRALLPQRHHRLRPLRAAPPRAVRGPPNRGVAGPA